MVLELHIWGPAFSLPSIDPRCIAAVAYLTQAVPRGEWILVASGDPQLSPTGELPALRNENVWVGGFRNIVDYVAQYSSGEWSLDAELEGRDRADCIAFSAFLEAEGQSLIDLSLYISSQNYTTVTRPLYSSLLRFPLPYFIPTSIRSAAKLRTSHLGFSSLDIDASDPTTGSQKNESIIPPSLQTPQTTISSLLSASPDHLARIRLDALATTFLNSLQTLRGKKRFFVSQAATSLDCLALGYLSLFLLPDLPSPWLATCMRTKYPQLCAFVHDLQRSFFGGVVGLEDAYLLDPAKPHDQNTVARDRKLRAAGKGALPWSRPSRNGVYALSSALASSIADSIPLLAQLRQTTRLKGELEQRAEDEEEWGEAGEVFALQRREVWVTTAAVLVGLGAFVGFMVRYGLLGGLLVAEGAHGLDPPARVEENTEEAEAEKEGDIHLSRLNDFGDAGAALEVLAQRMQMGQDLPAGPPPPQPQQTQRALDVDLEVELPDRVS